MEAPIAIQQVVHSSGILEDINFETLIDQRISPGILVIGPPMQLVHMNEQAWELIRHINEGEQGSEHSKRAKGLLPKCLHQLCAEVFQHLRDRTDVKDWERFEIKHLIGAPQNAVLIRGFGVPDRTGFEYSRIVLLLETIGCRRQEINVETKERFQFTEREQTIVHYLSKGWTNKQIAVAVNLALPTVKEHIRHIMDKTKTNTRTGILVQVYRM